MTGIAVPIIGTAIPTVGTAIPFGGSAIIQASVGIKLLFQ
jgi:hypothetical protein